MSDIAQRIKKPFKKSLDFLAANIGVRHIRIKADQLHILMYHRILPKHDPRYASEEPGMIVEPETFQQHMQLVKKLFTPIHLSDWVASQQQGLALPKNACAITFDDGWADNYEYAYPIIQTEQVPITLFAVSDMIGTNKAFWPNQISELLQQYPRKQLESISWLKPYLSAHQNPREAASSTINQLKQFSDKQLHNWLQELPFEQASQQALPYNPGLMDWAQLKTMSQNNLVEIGSHTCNHFRLNATLDESTLNQEIINSKNRLQNELSQTINLFCYPNGDVCPQAIKTVKQHYAAAVTTQRGINKAKHCHAHTLNRIGIHQDMSHTPTLFKARLANWF